MSRRSFHLLALALLFAFAAVRWRPELWWPEPHYDEADYLAAFRRAGEGRSPYEVERFLYPPAFAALGAAALERWEPMAVLLALRQLNLLAACAAVWTAVSLTRWRRGAKLAAAALALGLSPPLALALSYGNLSLLAAGATLVGLAAALSHPLPAGALLGMGLALKPAGAGAAVLLAAHRPAGRRRWRAPLAALTALAAALALLATLGSQHLGGMLARSGGLPRMSHNLSLSRILYCFGLEVPPALLSLGVLGAGVLWIRAAPRSRRDLLVIAPTVSVLALPVVWAHTLLLSLPVQFLALERAWSRFRRPPPDLSRLRRRYELPAVLLGIAAVHGSHGSGSVGGWPLPLQGLAVALPALAPLALSVYRLRGSGGGDGDDPGPGTEG